MSSPLPLTITQNVVESWLAEELTRAESYVARKGYGRLKILKGEAMFLVALHLPYLRPSSETMGNLGHRNSRHLPGNPMVKFQIDVVSGNRGTIPGAAEASRTLYLRTPMGSPAKGPKAFRMLHLRMMHATSKSRRQKSDLQFLWPPSVSSRPSQPQTGRPRRPSNAHRPSSSSWLPSSARSTPLPRPITPSSPAPRRSPAGPCGRLGLTWDVSNLAESLIDDFWLSISAGSAEETRPLRSGEVRSQSVTLSDHS
ncbi:hypothetical protein C8Q80DRAFT_1344082 [Daedaleopsis nitida]|nr:hypothetical protein C8Q80DRAFT_1344082 [Daedaleopsis nitida]